MLAGELTIAKIKGRWERDFIEFEMNKLGHVAVRGEIFEHSESPQSLKFYFVTDQTVIPRLLRDLEALSGS